VILPELARRFEGRLHRLVTPKSTVAGPTVEALRFAGSDPPLRQLYVNLLAASMDKETAHKAHPAFVEIIKQLSPDEARVVALLSRERALPLGTVGHGPVLLLTRKLSTLRWASTIGQDAGCEHAELTASYLVNICRLGLAELRDETALIESLDYHCVMDLPVVKAAVGELVGQGEQAVAEKEALSLTELGRQFCDACVSRPVATATR
jgi:hypothetical protein